LAQFLLQPLFSYLRLWDKTAAASRVDYFIANSKNVAKKIKKIYARSSEVVYPFVDTDKFKPYNNQIAKNAKRDYYLVVTRLLPWKQVNIAILAANELKFALKIVGLGPDLERLKKMAGKTIEFLGEVDDETLVKMYQNARATIITQEEDFGLVALESQACGTPVIAYMAGGNLETIIEGETGLFFSPQNAEALKNVIISFRQKEFNSQKIYANANNFSKENFKSQLMAVVNKAWQQKNQI
jgi:glycosyltransferase involved in cell wall biosynthesis